MKLRSSWLTLIIAALLPLFSGCGQGPAGEKLSYDRPDDKPQTSSQTNPQAGTETRPETFAGGAGIINENVRLEGQNVGGRPISEISAQISKRASATAKKPVNATFNSKTWAIIPGKKGKSINVEKTVAALSGAKKSARVRYVYDELSPAVSADALKGKIRVIGEYTTTLLDRSDSRVNNIWLASRKINYTILAPGEEFSFNRTVGRRTAAKGYEEAPIIVKTPEGPKKKKAKGGGICQISTTMYNAVEKSGLKVTERHMHSKNVGYVPRGDDATVSYGSVDFRFVNNREHSVMLRVRLNRKSLTVRILENSS